MRMYLYGRFDPEVSALIQNRAFSGLVTEFFASDDHRGNGIDPELAEQAVSCGLIDRHDSQFVPGSRLSLVPAAAVGEAEQRINAAMARYAAVVAEVTPTVRHAFEETAAAEQFQWSQVCHAVIAGMMMDLAVGHQLWRTGLVEREYWETCVWAFERASAHNAFGVQLVAVPDTRSAFAQLWHRSVDRAQLMIKATLVGRMLHLARQPEQNAASPEMLYLRYLKLVDRDEHGYHLTCPFFDSADCDRLFAAIGHGAERLLREAVGPAVEAAVSGDWWRRHRDDNGCLHAAVRLILELATDRVLAAGALEQFPVGSNVGGWWGRWLWQEGEGRPSSLLAGTIEARPSSGETQ